MDDGFEEMITFLFCWRKLEREMLCVYLISHEKREMCDVIQSTPPPITSLEKLLFRLDFNIWTWTASVGRQRRQWSFWSSLVFSVDNNKTAGEQKKYNAFSMLFFSLLSSFYPKNPKYKKGRILFWSTWLIGFYFYI